MKNYTALTIGPIYKTLGSARHTRELWAASYTFSYLMKNVLRKVEADKTVVRKFVLPFTTEAELKKPGHLGAGVWPDRLIYRTAEGGQAEWLKQKSEETLAEFAKSVAKEFQDLSGGEREIAAFFRQYFRFYVIEKPLPDEANPILELSPCLDALELQANFAPKYEAFLETFFNRVNSTFLVQDGYDEDRVSYDTLVEIAAKDFEDDPKYQELRKSRVHKRYGSPAMAKDDDTQADADDTSLILHLKSNKDFRSAHKYVAIVHSDGDNIGRIIKSLKTPEQFESFSAELGQFSRESVETVQQYGGMPIYAGGDDLVFFAPVINKKRRTNIINLLRELDQNFVNKLEHHKTSPPPSLSFGVSVTYYKFPLFEALEASRGMLHEAKRDPKRNIGLRVMKHSGQTFDEALHIGSGYFEQFMRMLDRNVTNEETILGSVVYKIHENEKLFSLIGRKPDRVKNLIHNSFNEQIHESQVIKNYLSDVCHLLSMVFSETHDDKIALDRIYTMLRTISFFKEEDTR